MNSFLSHIQKPLRYIGNEIGSVHKNWDEIPVKFAICYPDLYELGMSYLGLRIIYSLLNSRDDTLCERVFAPWLDMEEYLRRTNTPLMSLESGTPLKNFDCIGFSLQYELTYTNVLNILNLAQIPINREERSESHPLIIAGGAGTLNPAPIARFFDCLFIGEAEPILPKFIPLLKEWTPHLSLVPQGSLVSGTSGKTHKRYSEAKASRYLLTKNELLEELSKIDGLFIPALNKQGGSTSGTRLGPAKNQFCSELQDTIFPSSPILPFLQIEHDTLVIEIARGCTRGCRFCQPGMTRRPYRERNVTSILEIARTGTNKTGYKEVSLLALSAPQHSQFPEIIRGIRGLKLVPSLPSLPADSLTPEIINLTPTQGFTIAPEAGTDRLRQHINKSLTDSQIINSCELIANHGATHLKLYFMIGFPDEKDEDIDGIIELTHRISKIMKGRQINVSLSPFLPKPHTPFQWYAQELPEKIEEKIKYIRDNLNSNRIKVKYRSAQVALIEGIISRGDEKVSYLLEEVWRNGAKFEGWSEQFKFELWQQAFTQLGIDPYFYLQSRSQEEKLPWDVIDSGIKKDFFIEESKKLTSTIDCRIGGCTQCGICETPNIAPLTLGRMQYATTYGRRPKQTSSLPKVKTRFRIKFEKTEELRFLGHLDMVRAITRAIERAKIPVVYSEGFVKRQRISFSPPLPFGITSKEEYFDILLESPVRTDIKSLLNQTLPDGLGVIETEQIWENAPSLFEEFKKAKYRISNVIIKKEKIIEFMSSKEIIMHDINIRNSVLELEQGIDALVISMLIGKVKPWWLLELLLEIPEEQAIEFTIERINLMK